MSEDMLKSIQKLIDSGKGDLKRLNEILNTLKQETVLYLSDYKYLESLFSQKEESQSKTHLEDKKVKEIKKGANTKQKPSSKSVSDESLSILKTRLASGEITLDEFQSLKKILKDN